jgi:hypothetical protein
MISLIPAIAPLLVHLHHSTGVVQYADNCPLRTRVGAILRVRDRIADRVGPCIPDWTVSKQLADQVKTISVLARTHLVKVVADCQPKAASFRAHGFHTCCLSRYLSNEFAGIKETFLLLFPDGGAVAVGASRPLFRLKRRRLCRRNADVRESRCGNGETNRSCDHVVARGR